MEHTNIRPPFDLELSKIADYIMDYEVNSQLAMDTAKLCFMDSMGCAMLALTFPACTKLLGPWVPGIHIEKGVKVPGTNFELDPIKAAFDLTTMIRWLDYNDTWLAAEWGHPSDNIGGILSVLYFITQRINDYPHAAKYTMTDFFTNLIKAYEIQGILALSNSFNARGLDHVILVKIAVTGIATKLLGGTKDDVLNALSQAWIDGQSLRTYRHAPNTGSRKSWAAGDAASRGVRLALMTMQGEMGYPSALSVKQWGFNDVLFGGKKLHFEREFGTYVMENILFKVAFPAEFHAQTAVECALKLHPYVKDKFEHIQKISINTQSAAVRIIDKTGPLHNPADRDHCLQYMIAVPLIEGKLTAQSYEEATATNPWVDRLRDLMEVTENPQYSKDYLDPNKRAIPNQVIILFKDGTSVSETCEYPIGHKRRREESLPLLIEKCQQNLMTKYSKETAANLMEMLQDPNLGEKKVEEVVRVFG